MGLQRRSHCGNGRAKLGQSACPHVVARQAPDRVIRIPPGAVRIATSNGVLLHCVAKSYSRSKPCKSGDALLKTSPSTCRSTSNLSVIFETSSCERNTECLIKPSNLQAAAKS